MQDDTVSSTQQSSNEQRQTNAQMQVFATKAFTFIVIGAGWGILKKLLNLCNKKDIFNNLNQYFSSIAFTTKLNHYVCTWLNFLMCDSVFG